VSEDLQMRCCSKQRLNGVSERCLLPRGTGGVEKCRSELGNW
jgi:hypothetical protein